MIVIHGVKVLLLELLSCAYRAVLLCLHRVMLLCLAISSVFCVLYILCPGLCKNMINIHMQMEVGVW